MDLEICAERTKTVDQCVSPSRGWILGHSKGYWIRTWSLLSQLHHFHLVSLRSLLPRGRRERSMTTVLWDFMDHMYNSKNDPLSWKPLLEISRCIPSTRSSATALIWPTPSSMWTEWVRFLVSASVRWGPNPRIFPSPTVALLWGALLSICTRITLDSTGWRRSQMCIRSVSCCSACCSLCCQWALKNEKIGLLVWVQSCYHNRSHKSMAISALIIP